MMKIEVPGIGTVSIRFAHPLEREGRRKTVCSAIQDKVLVASGKATCSREDVFCKALGRKCAMERMLEGWGVGREVRRVVWNEYWRRAR